MEVIIQPTSQEASVLGAKALAALIRKKPRCVLGLATGSTPLALYQELIRMHREEGLDFSGVTTFNLDEYLGLAPDHPASYHHFMRENLFRHINVQPRHVHIPDGLTRDVPAFCAAYERSIADAGGIDAQILGLGSDGHIGFNEPSSSLASRTRIKTLTARTRQDNARFFSRPEDVPRHVVTMGVGTIMDAHSILLFAFGGGKAEAVRQSVEGPVSANVPGSILQMHPAAQAFLDEGSAGALARADYYRWVYDHKPAWQKIG